VPLCLLVFSNMMTINAFCTPIKHVTLRKGFKWFLTEVSKISQTFKKKKGNTNKIDTNAKKNIWGK